VHRTVLSQQQRTQSLVLGDSAQPVTLRPLDDSKSVEVNMYITVSNERVSELALIISPQWRIAIGFAVLILLLPRCLRSRKSRWSIVALAFMALVQVAIPVSDIAASVLDGARYRWPAWLLWSLLALAAALFVAVAILTFRTRENTKETQIDVRNKAGLTRRSSGRVPLVR
jgi:hypothetical protein